jgi:uncharacterized delta-60 repeat protein
VKPRLEALEDRTLPSAGLALPPSFDRVTSPFSMQDLKEIVLPDGKILVGGTVNTGSSYAIPVPPGSMKPIHIIPVTEIELVRFNADGSLDTTFGSGGVDVLQPGGDGTMSRLIDFALGPDGKVVVAGTEAPVPGPGYWNIQFETLVARLNGDGSLDQTFNAGAGPSAAGFVLTSLVGDSGPSAVAVQSDGKIVVAGIFRYTPVAGNLNTVDVVRFNADGSLDTSFNPDGQQPGVAAAAPASAQDTYRVDVVGLVLQGDGKILVGVGAQEDGFIVLRFDADGSADTSFGSNGVATYPPPDAGNDRQVTGKYLRLSALTLQADGKIVESGQLDSGLFLVRLNADGSLDTSFGQNGAVVTGTDPDPQWNPSGIGLGSAFNQMGIIWEGPERVVVTPDGKIVVDGMEILGDESPGSTGPVSDAWVVARFNADGSLDQVFQSNAVSANDMIDFSQPMALAVAPDGSVIAAGNEFDAGQNAAVLALVTYPDGSGAVSVLPPVFVQPPAPAPIILPDPGTTHIRPLSAPPATPAQPVITPADAAFQTLVPPFAGGGAGVAPVPLTSTSPIAPMAAPALTALPAATLSQSEATAPAPLTSAVLIAPILTPPALTGLPAATLSQSEATARTSGAGQGATISHNLANLTDEPDGDGSLVLAETAEALEHQPAD